MKQYIELLEEIMGHGYDKGPARKGLPGTKEVFCRTMTFDLQKGFPLLTCRKMYMRGCAEELCWLLRGETNIKSLIEKGVNIWNKDAYRFYKLRGGRITYEAWLDLIKAGFCDPETRMTFGDLGKVYGYQWRCFGGQRDQIASLINDLKFRPDSRRHVVTAWNPIDYDMSLGMAALPACHMMFQCSVRHEGDRKFLDIMMLQRSCDMILGVPFDLAEYGMLCHILAKEISAEPGIFTWVGNSCHIYETHFEAAKELISRKDELKPLCQLVIKANKHFDEYEASDFDLLGYQALPPVRAELCVGE